jgi:drug/metabolite transporter (DMT)-like permease
MRRKLRPGNSPEGAGPDRSALVAFALLVVIGGSNAVAVRFSNLELPPFWGAAFRFSSAAALIWIIVLIKRIAVPRGRALSGALVYGTLSIGVSYACLYWALVFVPASLTMVVLSLGPLLTLFFAWAHGQESFHWRGLSGAVVAFAGILVGVGGEIGVSLPPLPLLALVVGAAAIAEASVLFKSFPKSDPWVVNALALSVGAAFLFLVSLVAGEVWNLPTTSNTWTAYAYLVIGGSVLLFYLYLYVLTRWTASATSYSFLLFPVATIVMASWLAGEVITLRFLAGTVVVLAGVWLGALSSPAGRASQVDTAETQKAIQ